MKDDCDDLFDGADVYGVYDPEGEMDAAASPEEAIVTYVKLYVDNELGTISEAIEHAGTLSVYAYQCGDADEVAMAIANRRYTADEVRTIVQAQAPDLFA